jgi:hypothetical protein
MIPVFLPIGRRGCGDRMSGAVTCSRMLTSRAAFRRRLRCACSAAGQRGAGRAGWRVRQHRTAVDGPSFLQRAQIARALVRLRNCASPSRRSALWEASRTSHSRSSSVSRKRCCHCSRRTAAAINEAQQAIGEFGKRGPDSQARPVGKAAQRHLSGTRPVGSHGPQRR